MGSPDMPEPPDPKDTSAAQTGTSVSTAIANAWLGNTNRVGPDGTSSWSQTGTHQFHDPYTNKTYTVPTFTNTVELSDQGQAIYDKNQQAKFNIADLASQQSGFLKDYMAKPIDLSNEATEARLFELGRKRLDPAMAQRDEALRSRLANQGIFAGSEAYDREIERMSQQNNDAYNQLLLSGRGQAVQEAIAERSQPINEITALLSGSQVAQPQFQNNQQPQIPTTDNAGLINQNYQQQANNAMMQYQHQQGILGGLFGLGAGVLASDRRLKENIRRVGTLFNGMSVYSYNYKGGDTTMLGLMADEVLDVIPEAVHTDPLSGLQAVDYAMAVEDV